MRFSATNILNCTTIAGAMAMMLYGAYYSSGYMRGADGVDTMTTASVTGSAAAHAKTQTPLLADQFTVFNHADNRSCVMRLHRAEGYDVHRIEPSENCRSVMNDLATARAWQENARGTVTIADRAGHKLMKLARGDGFAWEVIEPKNADISFDAF